MLKKTWNIEIPDNIGKEQHTYCRSYERCFGSLADVVLTNYIADILVDSGIAEVLVFSSGNTCTIPEEWIVETEVEESKTFTEWFNIYKTHPNKKNVIEATQNFQEIAAEIWAAAEVESGGD